MDSLIKDITVVVNKFIDDKPDDVIDNWKDFVCQYCSYFDEESFLLLERYASDIPSFWDDIASYGCLHVKWAIKYEKDIRPSHWSSLLNLCETDNEFHWVVSHMDELPHWVLNEDHEVYKRFSHLFRPYKIGSQ